MRRAMNKSKFEYRPRHPALLLKRLAGYEQDARGASGKIRPKHDPPIAADKSFILCLNGIHRAHNNLCVWRANLCRCLAVAVGESAKDQTK